MKRTSIIILAALLGATLHTGCKKEDNSTMAAANYTTTMQRGKAAAVAVPAFIGYRLTINPSTGQSLAQWQKGQLNATALIFNGGLIGNTPQNITPVSFSKSINVSASVFTPLELGLLDVRSGLYNTMEIAVRLSPGNGPALTLGGNYNLDGKLLYMDFIVETDVILTGHLQGPMNLNASKYKASLSVNIDDLMANIDQDLIRNATITNAESHSTIISKDLNPQLYQAMLQALLTIPVNVQLAPVAVPPDTYITEKALF
jgi:hypothetical protein